MKHLAGWLLIWICGYSLPTGASGQIVYTAAFTHLLDHAGLEYFTNTEEWLHVTIPPEDVYMDYHLVLENDRNDFEVRYHISDSSNTKSVTPAAVEVARLVATIATNDENSIIRIQIPPDALLHTVFNADRGILAYFTPKADFSEKPHGAILSLYKDNRPDVFIVFLYYDPAYSPLTQFRNIRYR